MHSLSTLGQSFSLLFSSRLRRWVLIPQLANLLLYIILAFSGWNLVADYLAQWLSDLPEWLSLLDEVLTALATLLLLIVFQFTFLLTANLIAAPFNSVIAEILLDHQLTANPFAWSQLKLVFSRELSKLGYILPRAILILLLSFIPLVGPILAAFWGAWILMVNYSDYAQEVAGRPFKDLPKKLAQGRISTLLIGFCFSVLLMVPLLNLLIPAWATIAGCKHWQALEK